jgi:hypothetical protein
MSAKLKEQEGKDIVRSVKRKQREIAYETTRTRPTHLVDCTVLIIIDSTASLGRSVEQDH